MTQAVHHLASNLALAGFYIGAGLAAIAFFHGPRH